MDYDKLGIGPSTSREVVKMVTPDVIDYRDLLGDHITPNITERAARTFLEALGAKLEAGKEMYQAHYMWYARHCIHEKG